jgi:hypothetical protein
MLRYLTLEVYTVMKNWLRTSLLRMEVSGSSETSPVIYKTA